jgi:hypothetical protein
MISVFSFWQLSAVFGSYWVLCTCKSVFVDANMITFRVCLVESGPAYGQEWLLRGRVCVAEPHSGLTIHDLHLPITCCFSATHYSCEWSVLIVNEFIYSSGRGSGETISLQHIWAQAGIIMLTWFLRCVSNFASQHFLLSDQLFCFWTCHFIISALLSCVSILLVYDGKWQSCTCPHSHRCYQVSVLQSSGWRLRLQQGKGILMFKLSRGWLISVVSIVICF